MADTNGIKTLKEEERENTEEISVETAEEEEEENPKNEEIRVKLIEEEEIDLEIEVEKVEIGSKAYLWRVKKRKPRARVCMISSHGGPAAGTTRVLASMGIKSVASFFGTAKSKDPHWRNPDWWYPKFRIPRGMTVFFYSPHKVSLIDPTINYWLEGDFKPFEIYQGGTMCSDYGLSKWQGYHDTSMGWGALEFAAKPFRKSDRNKETYEFIQNALQTHPGKAKEKVEEIEDRVGKFNDKNEILNKLWKDAIYNDAYSIPRNDEEIKEYVDKMVELLDKKAELEKALEEENISKDKKEKIENEILDIQQEYDEMDNIKKAARELLNSREARDVLKPLKIMDIVTVRYKPYKDKTTFSKILSWLSKEGYTAVHCNFCRGIATKYDPTSEKHKDWKTRTIEAEKI